MNFFRSSKKKEEKETPPPSPKPATPSGPSDEDYEKFFAKYKAKDDDQLGPREILKLSEDVGIPPEDISFLILAHNLKAAKMGVFTHQEFVEGMKRIKAHNIDELKKFMSAQSKGFATLDAEKFRKLYIYAFKFCLENEKQKAIDVETAAGTLQLVMRDRPHTKNFIKFLQSGDVKGVNLDAWTCFLDFSSTIKSDLSNYDADSSYPTLLDEFVEYMREGKGSD